MKKATRDFAAWVKSIKGKENLENHYENGMLTLQEYIRALYEIEMEVKHGKG